MNQEVLNRLNAMREKYNWNMARDSAVVMPCANKACPCWDGEHAWCAAPVSVCIDEQGRCPIWNALTAAPWIVETTVNGNWIRDNEALQAMLIMVDVGKRGLPLETIAGWTDDQVRQVESWASAVHLAASDNRHRGASGAGSAKGGDI